MKEIPLTRGFVAIVDDEDYERLAQFKWQASNQGYAIRRKTVNGVRITIRMHREVIGAKPEQFVDHINHNSSDNRKSNLRFCTKSQNMANASVAPPNKTGFKGVSPARVGGRYCAQIMLRGRMKYLGTFDTPEEAHEVYCLAADLVFGEFFNRAATRIAA